MLGLEQFNGAIGRGVSWLTLAMVLVTVVVVVLRKFAGLGWIWLQETVTWMHGAVFMLAAAWTLGCGEHVRVDILYRRLSSRGRAMVDLAGILVLLVPTCTFILFSAWHYVAASWAIGEASREAGGLPGLFLLKSIILVMPALLLLQAVAMGLRAWLVLRGASARPGSSGTSV